MKHPSNRASFGGVVSRRQGQEGKETNAKNASEPDLEVPWFCQISTTSRRSTAWGGPLTRGPRRQRKKRVEGWDAERKHSSLGGDWNQAREEMAGLKARSQVELLREAEWRTAI